MKTSTCEKTFPFSKQKKICLFLNKKSFSGIIKLSKKFMVYRVFHKNNKNQSDPRANSPEVWLIP